MLIDRRLINQFDWMLLGTAIALPLVGLLVLYSAGYNPDSATLKLWWIPFPVQSPAFAKQSVYIGIGLVVMLVAISLSPQFLSRYAYFFYGLCFLMLLAVIRFGITVNNSQRWLAFGGVRLQPSEVMKLAVILGLARWLSRHPPDRKGYKLLDLVAPFLFFLCPAFIVARQPDLGTAISIVFVGFAMVLFLGIHWKALAGMGVFGLLSVVPVWFKLHDYQKRRILVMLDPNVDPKGSGYHIIQSKIAVGSGGLLGNGFLEGTQSHLEFVPEHTTDFIFSVLAEEWGFAGCLFVLALYFLFLFRILRVVARSKELFACLVAFGVATLFFFHAAVNMGMVVGLFPVVGIPLPLFSYGGSAVLTNMAAIGIVLGVGMRRLLFVGK